MTYYGIKNKIWKYYHVITPGPSDNYRSLKLVQTREDFVFHPMIGLWKRSPGWQPHWRNLGLRREFWANQRQGRSRAEHQSWLTTCPACPHPPAGSQALGTQPRSPSGWREAAWRGGRRGSAREEPAGVSWGARRFWCSAHCRPGWGTAEAQAGGGSSERGKIEMTGWHHCAVWWPSGRAESSHPPLYTGDFALHKPADCWDSWKTGAHRGCHSGLECWEGSFLVWPEESRWGWSHCEWSWHRSASEGWPAHLVLHSPAGPLRPPWPGTLSGSSCSSGPASSSWAGSPVWASPSWRCYCSCNRKGRYPRTHPCPALVFHGELLRSTCWGRDCDEWNSTWNKTKIIPVIGCNIFVISLFGHIFH